MDNVTDVHNLVYNLVHQIIKVFRNNNCVLTDPDDIFDKDGSIEITHLSRDNLYMEFSVRIITNGSSKTICLSRSCGNPLQWNKLRAEICKSINDMEMPNVERLPTQTMKSLSNFDIDDGDDEAVVKANEVSLVKLLVNQYLPKAHQYRMDLLISIYDYCDNKVKWEEALQHGFLEMLFEHFQKAIQQYHARLAVPGLKKRPFKHDVWTILMVIDKILEVTGTKLSRDQQGLVDQCLVESPDLVQFLPMMSNQKPFYLSVL